MHARRPVEPVARNDAAQMVVSCDCRAQYRVKRAHAGKAFRCKRCNAWITVPSLATSLIAPPDDDEVELELVETRLMQDLNDDPKPSGSASTSANSTDARSPGRPARSPGSGYADDGTYELADPPPLPSSARTGAHRRGDLDSHGMDGAGDEHELLAGLSRAVGSDDEAVPGRASRHARRVGGRSSKGRVWIRSVFIAVLVGTVALALHQAITNVVSTQGRIAHDVQKVDRAVLDALQRKLSGWSGVYLDEELTISRLDWLISSSTEGGRVVPFSGTIIDATSSRAGSLSGRLDFRTGHIEAEWQVDEFRNDVRMRLDDVAAPSQLPGDS